MTLDQYLRGQGKGIAYYAGLDAYDQQAWQARFREAQERELSEDEAILRQHRKAQLLRRMTEGQREEYLAEESCHRG